MTGEIIATDQQRSAVIALIGSPNAGKSTLLNQVIGAKISIVSPKVQTTRISINGICMVDNTTQLVFVDTPGIFTNPKRSFERSIVKAAWQGMADTDIIALLVDASKKQLDEDSKAIIQTLKDQEKKAILVLNKIDKVPHEKLLPLIAELNISGIFVETFMVSALNGDGVEDLKAYFASQATSQPWLFPEDQISDAPLRFMAEEITREKCFLRCHKEIPYALTVTTENWEEKPDGSVKINQVIYVQKENQKMILLGKGGQMIRKIGEEARKELTDILEQKVHLFLFVKVRENWMDNPDISPF